MSSMQQGLSGDFEDRAYCTLDYRSAKRSKVDELVKSPKSPPTKLGPLKDEILKLIKRKCLSKIEEANQKETYGRYLVKSRIDSRFIDDLNEFVRQKVPGCKLEMEFSLADKEIGDLYVITFMPTPAHDGVIGYFNYLFTSYQRQEVAYRKVLQSFFPRVPGFDPDGGMALYAKTPQTGSSTVYHRTVVLEVERTHRSLSELHDHMIRRMDEREPNTEATIYYGIGIKINPRQKGQTFSALCLLFKRDDVNTNPYCFHAYDFGTEAITLKCRTFLLSKLPSIEVPMNDVEVPIPYRVTLDANHNLVPPNSPWKKPTFSIPGRFIFGNIQASIVLGGITVTIPDNPTDLDVDLFEILNLINDNLP